MLDRTYEEQISDLLAGIRDFTKRPVAYGLQIYDKPKVEGSEKDVDYPFYGYNIISNRLVQNIPFITQDGEDVITVWKEQWEFTIGFTAISLDIFQSIEYARLLSTWFENVGYQYLSSKQIVKVRQTPITQRDMFLVFDYERRQGLDVTIRLGREIEKRIPRILDVELPPLTIL